MHAPIHLAISWLIGHRLPERRDRRLVAWSGVVPDLDALSLVVGAGAYSEYHHVLAHGIVAAVVGTALWTALARQRLKVMVLSLVAFHVHLLCDLLGSGRDWSIVYFFPSAGTSILRLTVGHWPRHKTPSFGWPRSLQRFGSALNAAGRSQKRSSLPARIWPWWKR